MSVRIGLSFGRFPFSGSQAFWRWVDACEDSAVDSIFLSDRIVGPQLQTEVLVTLAAIAGRTRRLKIGTDVVVLPLRDPVLLAKECASIDFLSDGRFLPMFGIGNDSILEWQAMGVSPRDRGRKSNEMLEILTRLWSGDSVQYDGKYFHVPDVSVWPKPKQSPLPLWIGGESAAAVERTARYGHGWIGGSNSTPARAGRLIAEIKAKASELGRSIPDDHFGAGFNYRFGSWDEPLVQRIAAAIPARMGVQDPHDALAVGDAEIILNRIAECRAVGVSKFVLRPIATSDDEMMEQSLRLNREVIPLAEKMA